MVKITKKQRQKKRVREKYQKKKNQKLFHILIGLRLKNLENGYGHVFAILFMDTEKDQKM